MFLFNTITIFLVALSSIILAAPTTVEDVPIAIRQQIQCGWLHMAAGGLPDMMKAQDLYMSARPGQPWTKVDNYACKICMTFAYVRTGVENGLC
jgi:hypothetical protein